MADVSLGDLEAQLAEVEDQIKQQTGSPSFNVGNLSVDEEKLYSRLVSQRADLQWRINNMRSGGDSNDNCRGASFSVE